MFESFVQGLSSTFQLNFLLIVLLGSIIGLIVGIIPTMGGILGMALLLPFVFGQTPEIGLGLLAAFLAVTPTGGSMTSILVNIPGTGINVATVIDGFPMAQKGEGARAIGAALMSSVTGGVASIGLAFIMIPLIVPFVLAFKLGDMAVLMIFGIMMVAIVSQGSILKGVISGILGMMVALVGFHTATGTERFMYHSVFLWEGISVLPVAIGMFGIATLFDMLVSARQAISTGKVTARFSDMMLGVKDVWTHKWLWFRSMVIGYFVGIIPAAGGHMSTLMAYTLAKNSSKTPECFGQGCVEGVIAPEAANNATESGGVLTTLVFGVPGTAAMVVLIGAIYMVGIIPGPAMARDHLPLIFTLLTGMAVANIIAVAISFAGASQLVKIAYVPFQFLFPAILAIIFIGTYAEDLTMLSVIATVIFGILGFLMARFGFSRVAFSLAFVLARLFEYNLFGALKLQGNLFFLTPISLFLIILIIVLFTAPFWRRVLSNILHRRSI